MNSKITPLVRQKILQSVNAVVDLRPFGVVLAVDGQAAVVREPRYAPAEHHFIVVDIKTGKSATTEVVGEGAMMALNCSAAVVAASTQFFEPTMR